MSYDSGKKGRSSFNKVRGYTGMSMGVIYLIIAGFIVNFAKADPFHLRTGTGISYLIAGLMGAYGIFRIYRGYKMSKEEE
jgi:hypothetical protein